MNLPFIISSGRNEALHLQRTLTRQIQTQKTVEGERQRQILQAQGDAEATKARAEAERFRQLTVAEGEAE